MKHRLLWILLALSVLWVSLTGHPQATWIEWYGHEDEVHVGGVLDMGTEYWLYGTSVASMDPPAAGIVVLKVQTDGTLIHPVSYDWDGVTSAADAVIDEAGNVLFAGRTNAYGAVGFDAYVLKTDPSGQTLAEWVYGDALDESAARIFPGTHGDYYLVGNQTNPDDPIADASTPGYGGLDFRSGPYVARIQPSGAADWKRDFRTTANEVVFDAALAYNGDCYVLSTAYGFPNAEDALCVHRVADHGGMMWKRTFGAGSSKGYGLHALDSGWLLVAGSRRIEGGEEPQGLLLMLSAIGREVWSGTFGDPGAATALHALAETDDGLFVAAGTQIADHASYEDDIYIVCVDIYGEMQWEETISMGKHVVVEDLVVLDDGGFLVAGGGAEAGEPFQAFLLRVDP